MGSVCSLLNPYVESTHFIAFFQLEFSLLALRDDPLPPLEAQIKKAQEAGNRALENELLATLTNENAKRERWAVSSSFSFLGRCADIWPVRKQSPAP